MKITEIYKEYKIPPNLQLHQLRVAAVAKLICDNFKKDPDKDLVLKTSLLHDMGNIIKFNFDIFDDDFYKPEGRTYWKNVQDEFKKKYGKDEHVATTKILKELSMPNEILTIADNIGLGFGQMNIKSKSYERKICAYSDMRVAPKEIVSLSERINDLKKRYVPEESPEKEAEYYDRCSRNLEILEKQIFEYCKIEPRDINDKTVTPLIEDLKNFEISTDLEH